MPEGKVPVKVRMRLVNHGILASSNPRGILLLVESVHDLKLLILLIRDHVADLELTDFSMLRVL